MHFLSNLSKKNSKSKNCWYYLRDADIISFFVAGQGKKCKKLTKIVKIKELKLYGDIESE